MNKLLLRNYFSYLKLSCQLLLMAYIVVNRKATETELSILVCLIAVFLLVSTLFESREKGKWLWIIAGGIILIFGYIFVSNAIALYLPFWLLDLGAGLLKLYERYSISIFLLPVIGFLLPEINSIIYFFGVIFCAALYIQHYFILGNYKNQINSYKKEENRLKNAIESHETKLKEELMKRSLSYENRILAERARLSQELHDKLGHSINGSIYQLEAGKTLLAKDMDKSLGILQDVIDNLRTGMDEIRAILRKEKPDKTQMAILQLHGLSAECREKFDIEMEVEIKGDSRLISNDVWEVILDNAFEAVTNALKYSACQHISLNLNVMNKIVRLVISDNGKGCTDFVPGMGIEGMKQRVRRLNGTIDIDTINGFSYQMLLPLEDLFIHE